MPYARHAGVRERSARLCHGVNHGAAQQGVEADEAEHNGPSQLNSSVSPAMRVIHAVSIAAMLTGMSAQTVTGQADRPIDQDQVIVAVVLEDLALNRGKDSPIDEIFSPDPLTLDPTPSRYSISVSDLLQQNEPKKWQALAAGDRPALREAAADFVSRMRGPIRRFTAGSKHVPLYTGDPTKLSPFSFREAPIQAALPGYSKDRRLAIVTLAIPWSIHGCSGTYVLLREGESWLVRVREFACYV